MEHPFSLLEILGAFTLFIVIVLAALTAAGLAKWSVTWGDDEKNP